MAAPKPGLQAKASTDAEKSAYEILTELFAEDPEEQEEEDSDSNESCPASPALAASATEAAGGAWCGAVSSPIFNEVHVRVPSRVILFGEHGVSHGKPALVGTLPLFLEVRAVAEEGLEQSILEVH